MIIRVYIGTGDTEIYFDKIKQSGLKKNKLINSDGTWLVTLSDKDENESSKGFIVLSIISIIL